MLHREKTLTVKMTKEELLKVHALADAGDETVGRLVRKFITTQYERQFGSAPIPPHIKLGKGRPKKRR
jgi:hypothetical protein